MELTNYNGIDPSAPSPNPVGSGAFNPLAIADSIVQAGSNWLSNRQNMKLAQYQNKVDWDRWNAQNRYNNPSAQMDRMRRAGLNPAMMYKGNPQNVSTGIPRANRAEVKSVAPQLGSFMQSAQIANIQAQTRATELENKKREIDLGIDRPKTGYGTDGNEAQFNLYYQKLNKTIEGLIRDNEIKWNQADLQRQEMRIKELASKLADQGVNINDNVLLRQLAQALAKEGTSIQKIISKFISKFK